MLNNQLAPDPCFEVGPAAMSLGTLEHCEGDNEMANVNATTAQVVGRARTVISQTKRKGEALATELAKKPAVKQARKKVARVRGQAVALAGRVTDKISDKITGRARRRKRARVAAAVVGAAAVATAAGISMARKRKR